MLAYQVRVGMSVNKLNILSIFFSSQFFQFVVFISLIFIFQKSQDWKQVIGCKFQSLGVVNG